MSSSKKIGDISLLQKINEDATNALDFIQYKTVKTYLTFLGINPYQDNKTSNARISLILLMTSTIFFPMSIKFLKSLTIKDYDAIFDDLPQIFAAMTSFLKLFSLYMNRTRFRKIFDSVKRVKKLVTTETENYVLNKFVDDGAKLAYLYRNILLSCMMFFLFLPLYNPLLDAVLPLNESRPRRHIFRVDYVLFDEYKYFYVVYVHLTCMTVLVIALICIIDSLYIITIHHACVLFIICGYQFMQATENSKAEKGGSNADKGYSEFKRCVMLHHEALQHFEYLSESFQFAYLLQSALNILNITMTAVKLVIFLGQPEEAIRLAVFFGSQQVHLFMCSLPGQMLIDYSSGLINKIYGANWYDVPVRIQKLMYLMQIRCKKPCTLTAGGLFVMNIEGFGLTVKACSSYITMFLSLRE